MTAASVQLLVFPLTVVGGEDAPLWSVLWSVLSDHERRRAEGFRFDDDRRRFVVGRGRLRQVLAERLAVSPADLRFDYGEAGKPQLANAGSAEFGFNLSNAGDVALLAISDGPTVGVDLEPMGPVKDRDAVARHFFSPLERAALTALPDSLRDAGFLRCWTRKEAFVKALGGGLQIDLMSFAVSLDEVERPAFVWSSGEDVVNGWWLADVSHFVPGHVAALAGVGKSVQVTGVPLGARAA